MDNFHTLCESMCKMLSHHTVDASKPGSSGEKEKHVSAEQQGFTAALAPLPLEVPAFDANYYVRATQRDKLKVALLPPQPESAPGQPTISLHGMGGNYFCG